MFGIKIDVEYGNEIGNNAGMGKHKTYDGATIVCTAGNLSYKIKCGEFTEMVGDYDDSLPASYYHYLEGTSIGRYTALAKSRFTEVLRTLVKADIEI